MSIRRHAIAVATSIRDRGESWWGYDDWRWHRLCELGRLHGYPQDMLGDQDYFGRGLLEWSLSVEQSEGFFDGFPPRRVVRVHYETLLEHPEREFAKMVSLIGANTDRQVIQRMCTSVGRPTSTPPDNAAKRLSERTISLLDRLGYGVDLPSSPLES